MKKIYDSLGRAKKFKKHLLTSIQKLVAVRTSGLVSEARVERVERTKIELELMILLTVSLMVTVIMKVT